MSIKAVLLLVAIKAYSFPVVVSVQPQQSLPAEEKKVAKGMFAIKS